MIYNKITDYLRAKASWDKQHTRFENGLLTVNGIVVPIKEFYQYNTKPRFEWPLDQSNPDKTNIAHGCKTKHK